MRLELDVFVSVTDIRSNCNGETCIYVQQALDRYVKLNSIYIRFIYGNDKEENNNNSIEVSYI